VLADEAYESDSPQALFKKAPVLFCDFDQFLAEPASNGNPEAPSFVELFHQGCWDTRRSRRDNDRIIGRVLDPTQSPIKYFEMDISISQSIQCLLGSLQKGVYSFNYKEFKRSTLQLKIPSMLYILFESCVFAHHSLNSPRPAAGK
jgi:hypothetical protein